MPLSADLPDARDGLTRMERIVLFRVRQLQEKNEGKSEPTALLYGDLIEQGYDISREELSKILRRLLGKMDL